MTISAPHRHTTLIAATLLSLVGLLDAQDTGRSRDSPPDRSQARAEAERSYDPVRHLDAVTKAASIDLVVRGDGAGARSVVCSNGDSADIVVGLRLATTGTKQELSIYAISVGRTWRYLEAMRLLVDDWLLTPRPVAAPGPELTHYARGVIETSAYAITRRQLVLIARAKSVQIRLIGAGGLCDLALDPVDQEVIGLFVERELASPPRGAGSGAPSLSQAQPLRVTARSRSTSTSNRNGLAR